MADKQTDGGKPDGLTSSDAVKRNGQKERQTAGPDAAEIGDTFKTSG